MGDTNNNAGEYVRLTTAGYYFGITDFALALCEELERSKSTLTTSQVLEIYRRLEKKKGAEIEWIRNGKIQSTD